MNFFPELKYVASKMKVSDRTRWGRNLSSDERHLLNIYVLYRDSNDHMPVLLVYNFCGALGLGKPILFVYYF